MAHLPSMPYQVDMQRVYPLRWRHLCKSLVSLVGIYLGSDQSQTLTHPENMRINRHKRHAYIEHQYTSGSFWPNTWNATQISPGFFRRIVSEHIKREWSCPSFSFLSLR